jgi:hypothetical protein
MSIRQFVKNSGVKKYKSYKNYESFLSDYKGLAKTKSARRKNPKDKMERLDFDINFSPRHTEKWRLAIFKEQWENLEKFASSK